VQPSAAFSDWLVSVEGIVTRCYAAESQTAEITLIDGHNRARGCHSAGVAIRTVDYVGEDPLGFVLSTNLHRRHLVESQRALVAARLATMHQGARIDVAQMEVMSLPAAADALNVSRSAVHRARIVQERQQELADATEATLRGAVKSDQHVQRETELVEKTQAASKALGRKLYDVIYADSPWQFTTGSHRPRAWRPPAKRVYAWVKLTHL
jgi:hypothetical protein